MSSSEVQVLNVDEFKTKMAQFGDNAVLLDVRTKEEVEQGKIPGAVHIDFYQEDFKDKINELDQSVPYLIYCASGGRSNKTATLLLENGFTEVYDLKGGIRAWKAKGEPVD
ncbi:MAG: rhodanese-like domain-containing protein [Reichenbachiella sp.]